MKITIIHGQSHKGSTYHISKILADKLDGMKLILLIGEKRAGIKINDHGTNSEGE
ncbi:hypothetical protein [Anaerostipes sp. Marseille-Q3525]|uniref:hypothetical protein n=1 Tax=Anaerostipes sp. Marseille-Q3525 TaxID=2758418 RepID=UPI002ED1D26F